MLARKTLLHFLNTVVGGILGAIALKLIALYMGDAILGQVAYALGILSIGQSLFSSGIRTTHEKRMGEGHREGDKIVTYLYLQLGLSAGFATTVGLAILVWIGLLGEQVHSTTLLVLVVVTAHLMAQNLRQVSVNTFNGRREIARSQTITFLDDLIRVAFTVLATTLFAAVVRGRGPLTGIIGDGWGWVEFYGAELLALTYLAGTGASALLGLVMVWRTCPIGSFDLDVVESYWQFAWPLFLVGVAGTLTSNLDRVMIGYFWMEAEVGLYFGMDRILHIIRSIAFALGTILVPAISRLAEEEDRESVAEVSFRAHRYTTMVILPMIAGVIVFAEPLIRILLADEFVRGVSVLVVLSFWVFFLVASKPFSTVVLGFDRSRVVLFVGLIATGLNLVLNLVLIPADITSLGISLVGLGALGAAIATLVSEITKYVGLRYFARKMVPIPAQWPSLYNQLAAVGGMSLILWGITILFTSPMRIYHILPLGGVGLLIYVGFMWVLGEFDREDFVFFYDVLHPEELIAYVKEELLGIESGEDDEP